MATGQECAARRPLTSSCATPTLHLTMAISLSTFARTKLERGQELIADAAVDVPKTYAKAHCIGHGLADCIAHVLPKVRRFLGWHDSLSVDCQVVNQNRSIRVS